MKTLFFFLFLLATNQAQPLVQPYLLLPAPPQPWSKTWQNAQVLQTSSDAQGNIYVCGSFEGNFEGNASQGNTDAFVQKYSVDGHLLWTWAWGDEHKNSACALVIDSAQQVYVVGIKHHNGKEAKPEPFEYQFICSPDARFDPPKTKKEMRGRQELQLFKLDAQGQLLQQATTDMEASVLHIGALSMTETGDFQLVLATQNFPTEYAFCDLFLFDKALNKKYTPIIVAFVGPHHQATLRAERVLYSIAGSALLCTDITSKEHWAGDRLWRLELEMDVTNLVFDAEYNAFVVGKREGMSHLLIKKISPDGHLLWEKEYPQIPFSAVVCVGKDNGLYLTTNHQIFGINNSGEMQHLSDFRHLNLSPIKTLHRTALGNFVLLGIDGFGVL